MPRRSALVRDVKRRAAYDVGCRLRPAKPPACCIVPDGIDRDGRGLDLLDAPVLLATVLNPGSLEDAAQSRRDAQVASPGALAVAARPSASPAYWLMVG